VNWEAILRGKFVTFSDGIYRTVRFKVVWHSEQLRVIIQFHTSCWFVTLVVNWPPGIAYSKGTHLYDPKVGNSHKIVSPAGTGHTATGRGGPRGSERFKAPDFLYVLHYEGGMSSAIRTGLLYLRRNPFQRLSRPQGTWFHRGCRGKYPQWHHRISIPGQSD
jgi:hypothetical protein